MPNDEDNKNQIARQDAIKEGAKAAREIGKSRERTFAIGFGLLAIREQVLEGMGKAGVNDRSVLKSGAYRKAMGAALKSYPAYTLETVFKNDSTRLAYLFCAEYKDQILTAFAAEELVNPGTTLNIYNPERIKSKFKSLTNPPRKAQAKKEADKEMAAQDFDAAVKKRTEDMEKQRNDAHWELQRLQAELNNALSFDTTPAKELADMLFDTSSSPAGRKNRLAFIDLVVKYATGDSGEGKTVAKAKRKGKAKDKSEPDLTIYDGQVYEGDSPQA